MKLDKTLQKIGFSAVAVQIYAFLISAEPQAVASIARALNKHRPVVYSALEELLEAKLISKTATNKRVLYRAESPAVLVALIKRLTVDLDKVLPDLIETFENKNKKPKVSYLEGKEGIATIYESLIASAGKNGKIYRYESPRNYSQNKQYYPTLYWKRAGSTGDIDKYVITNRKTHEKRHKNLNRESKAVADVFEENITELIVANKVAFIDYDTKSVVLIESERFADFQKKIFEMFFDKL